MQYYTDNPVRDAEISHDTIIKAMEAAGFHYDELESTDDNLRFMGVFDSVMTMNSWQEAAEWLDGAVFDDPEQSDRVEAIMHPERFPKAREKSDELTVMIVEPHPEKEVQSTYELYQLKDTPETRDYRFESTEHLRLRGLRIVPENYEKVYHGKVDSTDTLDSIYERFNLQHPDDFRGHSLSVSDVIVLHENGKDTAHFVDSYGFTEIPEFLQHDLSKVDDRTFGLAVDGHMGTWHTIDKMWVDGKDYYLMEHDTYGDEAAGIIVDVNGTLMAEDIYNGFDDDALEAIRETEAAFTLDKDS